jgi:DEAD/DEAH box helicase domain-containing protein
LFGSQVANVIRRLKRVCAFYGSSPTFICTSATIANPLQLAQKLLEEENIELVERNGAPRGERRLIFYNPPLLNREVVAAARCSRRAASRRRGSARACRRSFCRSRLQVEVMLSYLRQDRATPRRRTTSSGYRAGYSASST